MKFDLADLLYTELAQFHSNQRTLFREELTKTLPAAISLASDRTKEAIQKPPAGGSAPRSGISKVSESARRIPLTRRR